MIISGIT